MELEVDCGTSYELLCGAYVSVRRRGDGLERTVPLPAHLDVPTDFAEEAALFFGGDVALGMNLLPVVHQQGWPHVDDVVRGVDALSTRELLGAMLASPASSPASARRRDRDVGSALADAEVADRLSRALASEHFDVESVSRVLADPDWAAERFRALLGSLADLHRPDEVERMRRLSAGADYARKVLETVPPSEAISALTGGFTLRDVGSYSRVTLVGSEFLGRFSATRLIEGEQALVTFPITTGANELLQVLAEALKALSQPQRLAILQRVAARPATGQQLAEALGVSEPTVHHHTTLLRAAGLLKSERNGQSVYHFTEPDLIEGVFAEASALLFGPASARNGDGTDHLQPRS